MSIIEKILKFRNERDWEQFHNPKDLAVALNVEAGELLECYLWKSPEEASKEKVKEEIADVLIYAHLICHEYGFEPDQIMEQKLAENAKKYPVEKAKGNAKKYTEL